MTKMKSKKMTKSTFAVIIMAIAMVAMLAFGGTYAYFTATTTQQSDSVVTGTVKLNNAAFTLVSSGVVVPGMELLEEDNKVVVTDESNVNTYIFVEIELVANTKVSGAYTGAAPTWKYETETAGQKPWTVTKGAGYTAFSKVDSLSTDDKEVYVLLTDVEDENYTGEFEFITGIQLNKELKSNSADNAQGTLMDVQITLTVDAFSIQAEGIEGGTNDAKILAAYEIASARANTVA